MAYMTNKEKFLEAAKRRSFDELVHLLGQDDNINAKDEYTGYNALCLFIKNGGIKPKSDKLEEKSAVIDAVYYLMDKGLKIDAAIPGLSLTPKRVTLASLFVLEIPVIILLFVIFFLFVIRVPAISVKEDLTSISTLFNLAS